MSALLPGWFAASFDPRPGQSRLGLVYRIGSTPIYKKIFRYWYPWMTRRLGQQEIVVFLNWGY